MSFPAAILLVPGLLCDERLWQAQAVALTGSCEIIIGDTLQDDSIAGMARRMLATAPPRFALCGLSMGGYVAMEIMRAAPERVSHLVLADTTARQDSDEQKQRRLDFVRLAQRGKFTGVTPRLLPQLLASGSLNKPEITSIVMAMAQTLGREVYLRQQAAIMGRVDSRPSLEGIMCPAAVIVGAHDQLTPVAMAEEITGLIPRAKLHVVEGAGHLPPLEQPKAFNRVLMEFLNG